MYLKFIGPIFCPPGYTESWIKAHGGIDYDDYILTHFRQKAYDLVDFWERENGQQKTTMQDVTKCEINATDNGVPDISGFVGDKPVNNHKFVIAKRLIDYLKELKPDTKIDVKNIKTDYIPTGVPDFPKVKQLKEPVPGDKPLAGLSILCDAGHSKSRKGANGLPPDYPCEWAHNVLVAKHIENECSELGARCLFTDPDPDNLVHMGRLAKDYKLAIYSHHNAFDKDGVDEGTSMYIHPDASDECRRFAQLCVDKVSNALGSYNRGVKTAKFTVLKYAREVGCEFAILPEYYFIDDYGHNSVTKKRSLKAAAAMVEAIKEFFGTDNNSTRNLTRGDKGEDVTNLQRALNGFHRKHATGANGVKLDGELGYLTELSLMNFQCVTGLKVDGHYGHYSQKMLAKPEIKITNTNDKRVKIMRDLVDRGYKESDNSYNFFRHAFFKEIGSKYWAWCASTIHKVESIVAGKLLPIHKKDCTSLHLGWVKAWVDIAQKKNLFVKEPRVGDLAVMDWQPDGKVDHIGYVDQAVLGANLGCIEGNADDKYKIKVRNKTKMACYIRLPDDFEL